MTRPPTTRTTRRARRTVAAAALVAAGLLVPAGGAGAQAPPETDGGGLDACTLLDRSTISDAVGGKAGPAERPGGPTCRWFVRGALADRDERTVVFLTLDRDRGIAKRSLRENAEEESAVHLDGFDDAKFAFYDLEVQPPAVTLVKGRRIVIVQVGHLRTDRATVRALTALAEEAFANA